MKSPECGFGRDWYDGPLSVGDRVECPACGKSCFITEKNGKRIYGRHRMLRDPVIDEIAKLLKEQNTK